MHDCVGIDFNVCLFQKKQRADGLAYWSIIQKDTLIDFSEDTFVSLLNEDAADEFDSKKFAEKSFLEKFIYLMELNGVDFYNMDSSYSVMNFDGDAGYIWDVMHDGSDDIFERFNKATGAGICCQLSYQGLVSYGDAIESIGCSIFDGKSLSDGTDEYGYDDDFDFDSLSDEFYYNKKMHQFRCCSASDIDALDRNSIAENEIIIAVEDFDVWYELVSYHGKEPEISCDKNEDEMYREIQDMLLHGICEQLITTCSEMTPNIFTSIHLDENQHTELMRHILSRSQRTDGKALNAFFKMVKKLCPQFNFNPSERTVIKSQKDYIDLLISDDSEENKFSLIIENKICDAPDQKAQIEKYIQNERSKYDKSNIFVVYLTLDGSKQVSEESLTTDAKEWLDYTETTSGRFITMNYADHILPWLKEQNELSLDESVSTYIGYLEDMVSEFDRRFFVRLYEVLQAFKVISGKDHFSDIRILEQILTTEVKKNIETTIKAPLYLQHNWDDEFEKIYVLIRKKNLKKIQQIAREHFSDDLEIDESTIDSEWWRIRSKKMDQWFTGFDLSKGPAYGIYFNPGYLDATYPKLTIRLSFLLDTPGVKEFLAKKGITETNGKRYTPWQPNWQKVDDINLEDVVQKLIAEAEEKLTEFCEEYK